LQKSLKRMTKNNIDQGFNTSNKFISILCDNFVIDIQVQFKCFYGEILKLKNNGKFEKVFENLKTLINKKYLKLKILGAGELKVKLDINAHFASEQAKEKILKAGGKLNIIKK